MNYTFSSKLLAAVAVFSALTGYSAPDIPQVAAPKAPMVADKSFAPEVRKAIEGAVDKAGEALARAKIPAGCAISLLPLAGDANGAVEGLLKIAVTKAGLSYVEGRADPVFDEILKEVEWDTRKEDMLDAMTIDKFGRLKSTQALLYGFVRTTATETSVLAELELHLTVIATKEHIWGDSFTQRDYKVADVRPFTEIDADVRRLLRDQMVAKIGESLNAQTRLDAIKTVALLPLAGDSNSYVTWLVRDAMTKKTSLVPKEISASTRGDASIALRDKPQQADACLYGAVRDLSAVKVSAGEYGTKYKVLAEVQLSIENVVSRDVLWSDTIAVEREYVEPNGTALVKTPGNASAQVVPYSADSLKAISEAVKQAGASLADSRAIPAGTPVSILPICGDRNRAVDGLLKNAVTAAGKNCVEWRSDPVFAQIVDEINWDAAAAQILDGSTIDKFGKLQASRILIYGTVTTNAMQNGVFAQLELHATEVGTKKHLWGGAFAGRAYSVETVGFTQIPDDVRKILRDNITGQITASVKAQTKLDGVGDVAIVPLNGDQDSYVTYIVRDAFNALPGMRTADLGITTRAETIRAIRDDKALADAVLYGSVRQLFAAKVEESKYTETYNAKAEVQLCIENAATGRQLWSGTFSAESRYTKPKSGTRTQPVATNVTSFTTETFQAIEMAMDKAEASFRASAIPVDLPVSVLPLCNDRNAAVASRLKSAITASGRTCVEFRDDPAFSAVVDEIDWDASEARILDGSTIDRFGFLQASRALVYGVVHASPIDGDRGIYVELELHAAEVKTRKHLWGGVFTQRYYIPDATGPKYQDIATLPVAVREDLHDAFVEKLSSEFRADEDLSAAKTIVLVPLVGDSEKYCSTLISDSLAKAVKVKPAEFDVRTRGEALAALRDKPREAPALVWGSVLGYKSELDTTKSTPWSVTSNVYVQVQVHVEDAASRDMLFSSTVHVSAQHVVRDSFWNFICRAVGVEPQGSAGFFVKACAVVVVLLVALAILAAVIKAATRVR